VKFAWVSEQKDVKVTCD